MIAVFNNMRSNTYIDPTGWRVVVFAGAETFLLHGDADSMPYIQAYADDLKRQYAGAMQQSLIARNDVLRLIDYVKTVAVMALNVYMNTKQKPIARSKHIE